MVQYHRQVYYLSDIRHIKYERLRRFARFEAFIHSEGIVDQSAALPYGLGQPLSERRRLHLSSSPNEKRVVEYPSESCESIAHRGLRHTDTVCRKCNITLPFNRIERSEQIQIDGIDVHIRISTTINRTSQPGGVASCRQSGLVRRIQRDQRKYPNFIRQIKYDLFIKRPSNSWITQSWRYGLAQRNKFRTACFKSFHTLTDAADVMVSAPA